MPITPFQRQILQILADSRSDRTYLAGGLLAARTSSRISADIDYFVEGNEQALDSYTRDRTILEQAGFSVAPTDEPRPGFVRARVSRGDTSIRMDWAQESSWRFFPLVKTPETGIELHWADAATNKVLAMASRAEVRDGFDLLHWHRTRLSMGALIWAAAGKDLGFTPGLLLEEVRRNARVSPGDMSALNIEEDFDPVRFGTDFRQACREAEKLILALPPATAGHIFLGEGDEVVEPDPARPETLARPRPPSLRGVLPLAWGEEPTPEP